MKKEPEVKTEMLSEAMAHPCLSEPRQRLAAYRQRLQNILAEEHWRQLTVLKLAAVAGGDQLVAKAVWCLETIGRVQDHFVSAFQHMTVGEYKEAWDELERCEIEESFLDKHFREEGNEFGLAHVQIHTKRFQELYPYKWGVSPGFISKDIRCSICEAKITLRSRCQHEVGEIYDGETCYHVIKGMELLHIALVDNPVQKYSVIFPNGNDDRRFSLISYVVSALESPWDGWNYHKEVLRQKHPAFKGIGRNAKCPCGSGLKYKRCCLNKTEVFPHYELSFEKKPQIALPRLMVQTASQ